MPCMPIWVWDVPGGRFSTDHCYLPTSVGGSGFAQPVGYWTDDIGYELPGTTQVGDYVMGGLNCPSCGCGGAGGAGGAGGGFGSGFGSGGAGGAGMSGARRSVGVYGPGFQWDISIWLIVLIIVIAAMRKD